MTLTLEEWEVRMEESIFREGVDSIVNKILKEFKESVFEPSKSQGNEDWQEIRVELMRCNNILRFTPSTTSLAKAIKELIKVVEDKKGRPLEELMSLLSKECVSLEEEEEKNKKKATSYALNSIEKTEIIGVSSDEKKKLVEEISKELNKDWKIERLPLRKQASSFQLPKELMIFYSETKKEIGSLYELYSNYLQKEEASCIFIGVHSFSQEGVIAEKRLLSIARAAKERNIPFSVIAWKSKYCFSPPYILKDIATNSPFTRFWDFIPYELIEDLFWEEGSLPFSPQRILETFSSPTLS